MLRLLDKICAASQGGTIASLILSIGQKLNLRLGNARGRTLLHYSHKSISAHTLKRDKERRAIFMNHIAEIAPDPEMLMFGDEAAKDERTLIHKFGHSKIRTRCIQRKCFVQGKWYSILPILTLNGIIAYDIIEGPMTSERFVQFLQEHVLPLTNPYPGPCTKRFNVNVL
ncbi:hypothetical protein EV702DRAFT_1045036 [Suillus placidus]|uniref:Transposase n=1 Tax=Suillus placidus TaxID=48579 RepID=A0A9P6ZWP9_9AGAM|nr:hypothetical protein EV702DRAFT_1045036 [Suillus placidus]